MIDHLSLKQKVNETLFVYFSLIYLNKKDFHYSVDSFFYSSSCLYLQVLYMDMTYKYIEVIILTNDTFDELVMNPKSGKWFVKIYAPVEYCG